MHCLFNLTLLQVSIEVILDLCLNYNRIWICVFLAAFQVLLLLSETTLPKRQVLKRTNVIAY